MSYLCVYPVSTPDTPNKVLTHADDIASTLAEHGVLFERWQAATTLEPGASHAQVLAAYTAPIDRLMGARGYANVEVIHADADASAPREYRQSCDDAHFFVTGRGLFNLHIGDYVYAILCEKNDLLAVPAGVAHWFDAGERPHFLAIRLRGQPQGGGVDFTGDDIAHRFPRLDD
ncbi:acireductone dioxygenase [Pseudomonas sp. SDO528_S397]